MDVDLPDVGTDPHTLKMTFTGNQIQVYYDGALKINVTDNDFDSRVSLCEWRYQRGLALL